MLYISVLKQNHETIIVDGQYHIILCICRFAIKQALEHAKQLVLTSCWRKQVDIWAILSCCLEDIGYKNLATFFC